MVGVIIVYVRTKNLLLSCIVLMIFSLQFLGPNKFYFVEAIPRKDILEIIIRDGYFLGYGVNTANILIVLGMILVAREILISKSGLFFRSIAFKIISICGSFFILTALYSLSIYSPFPSLSLTWTLQYSQIFFVALVVIYAFKFYGSRAQKLVITALIWFAIFQSSIIIFQFFRQEYVGFSFELNSGSSFYTGLDENNAIFRPSGSFMYHNQASLLLALVLTVVLQLAFIVKKNIYFVTSFLIIVALILVQSRSIWITTMVSCICIGMTFKTEIKKLIQQWGYRRIILYALGLLLFLGPIVLPRVLLSSNFFYRGAGLPIRIDMLEEAVEVISNSFFFGFGPGTVEYITHSFFPDGVTTVNPTPVHNGFLQLMIETGFVGLMLFLLPFLYALRSIPFIKIFSSGKQIYLLQRSFLLCCWTILFYYLFLPHSGIVEFSYFGVFLALGYSTAVSKNYV
jgi:O-antigen ligase